MRLKIISLIIGLTFLVGCGGSGGSSDTTPQQSNESQEKECYQNVTIDPISNDAKIKVEKSSNTDCTSIILTQGEANITLDEVTQNMELNKIYKVEK